MPALGHQQRQRPLIGRPVPVSFGFAGGAVRRALESCPRADMAGAFVIRRPRAWRRPCSQGPAMSRGAIEGPSTGRDGQVPSGPRVAHRELPFRVVSAGSASRRALPPADGARAIPQSETIALNVGRSLRRVTIGGFAPRPSPGSGRRSHCHWTRMTHPLLDVSAGSRPARASRVRLGRGRQPPACGPLCGWPEHARQHPPFWPGWPGEHGQRSRAIPGPLTGDDRDRSDKRQAASGKRRTTHRPLRHARPSFPPAKRIIWHSYSVPEIHAMRADRTGTATTGWRRDQDGLYTVTRDEFRQPHSSHRGQGLRVFCTCIRT
jgi:hypothetical protein